MYPRAGRWTGTSTYGRQRGRTNRSSASPIAAWIRPGSMSLCHRPNWPPPVHRRVSATKSSRV